MSIEFNHHIKAQQVAYDAGKQAGMSEARTAELCCGDYDTCALACASRADHFKALYTETVGVVRNTPVHRPLTENNLMPGDRIIREYDFLALRRAVAKPVK